MAVKHKKHEPVASVENLQKKVNEMAKVNKGLETKVESLEAELLEYKTKQDEIDKDLDVLAGGIDEQA